MKRTPLWLRRAELVLWFVGISLVGGALGATWDRHHYQARQQAALMESIEPQLRAVDAAMSAPPVSPPTGTQGPTLPPDALARPEILPGEEPEAPGAPATAPPEKVPESARPQPKEDPPAAVDPGVFGVIEVSRIGLKAIVRSGIDEGTLARAVGLVPGTARPGDGGNVVMAGHRDSFFRPLRRIKVNDRIRLVVPPQTYEYQVEELKVVDPQEISVMDSRGVDELTLITCYPFRYVGPAPERFIVRAKRVDPL